MKHILNIDSSKLFLFICFVGAEDVQLCRTKLRRFCLLLWQAAVFRRGKGPVQKVMLLEIDLNMADSLSVSAFTRTVYDQCKNIPQGESSPVVL